MATPVSADQRFTRHNPCPVCGGHAYLPAGRGVRCYGFLSADGRYAHCTREEFAGGLEREPESNTSAHRLDGPCHCGETHGGQASVGNGDAPEPPPGASLARRVINTRRWGIRDGDGVVQAVHVRRDFDDGDKAVHWELPDGTSCLKGYPVTSLPLYGVHEIGDAKGVIIVEGEPARDALEPLARELGLAVVATVTGAPTRPSDDVLSTLPVLPIYLWPDSDKPGEAQMAAIARALVGLGRRSDEIRRVVWPDARVDEGDDAADFVHGGGTPDDLLRLDTPAWKLEEEPTPGKTTANEHRPGTDATNDMPRVRFMTAREFAQQTPDETEWVVAPYVPRGGIAKIDGPPKKAGKTTLITHLIAAVLVGADFLGNPTRPGPVVLLSEQGGTSLREALDRAGLLDRDDLHLATYRDLASVPWPDVVADTFARANAIGAVLIVVDTLPAVSGVRGDEENSAGRALEALAPVQVGAESSHIGVILSFHDRKGGGDVGESGRGSSAYAGAVDVILHVSRPGGNFKATVRKIEALSRFDATPEELYIELTPGGYISLGTEDDVVSAAVARTLLDVLPQTEEAAKRIDGVKDKDTGEITERGILDDLADQGLNVARSTFDLELKRWVEAGYVGQSGSGKKGSPYRYWLVAKPPPGFFRSKPSDPSEERINWEAPDSAWDTHSDNGVEHNDYYDDAVLLDESVNEDDADWWEVPIHSSDAPDAYNGRNDVGDSEGTRYERL